MQFKKILFLIPFLFASNVYADIVSVDNSFILNDTYSSDFSTRLNRDIVQLEDGINNIDDAQLKADTLKERSFADEINPRIRTAENACNSLVIDLLPVTSGSLTTDTAAGTAYPLGYRVRKNAVTSHSYTASKWTWLFIDINGDFTYTEGAIGSATPSTPANSIPVARVSTDASAVTNVQDLRLSECAVTIMDQTVNSTYEPTLHDILKNGIPVSGGHGSHSGTTGWIQGLGVQYLTGRTLKVKSGSVWAGAEYRRSSSDITVVEQAHNPVTGVSGICTGTTWAASTTYDIYAVADEASQKTFSVTACPTASGCSGCTNFRYLGNIKTSTDTNLVSGDISQAYSWDKKEILSSWINFTGEGTVTVRKSYNVSSIVDDGTGKWTLNWTTAFPDDRYLIIGSPGGGDEAGGSVYMFGSNAKTTSSVQVRLVDDGGGFRDATEIMVIAVTDMELV